MKLANTPTFAADFGSEPVAAASASPVHFAQTTKPAPRSKRRLLRFRSRTQNAALIAAIEDMDTAIAASEPLGAAHTAAEEAHTAALNAGATEGQLRKLKVAEEAADRRWMRAVAVADRAGEAMLRVDVDNAQDAALKQEVFSASYGVREMRDIWEFPETKVALAAARRDLQAIANLHLRVEALTSTDGQHSPLAKEWYRARDLFHGLRALEQAGQLADDDGRAFEVLERWESIPPPSVPALVEVMRASLNFIGTDWAWSDIDDPRTIREFLDSGDHAKIMVARTFQHLQRMTGREQGALNTPSVAGLFPAFSDDGLSGEALRQAWLDHHQDARVYPTRREELVTWWRSILADPATAQSQSVVGSENCTAVWDASRPADEDAIAERFQFPDPQSIAAE